MLYCKAYKSELLSDYLTILYTIDCPNCIVLEKKLKAKNIDETTKLWITSTEGKKINLPTKFLPHKKFIEYHNDIVFKI